MPPPPQPPNFSLLGFFSENEQFLSVRCESPIWGFIELVISFVGNLQLPAPSTFLTHVAAADFTLDDVTNVSYNYSTCIVHFLHYAAILL